MNKKILIVDDSQSFKEIIEKELASHGHIVFKASNGIEGIAKMKALKPDLVLLDVIMPEMDGMKFLKQVKSYEFLKNIPVLFLSVVENINVMREATKLGAAGYLIKPESEEDLKECYRVLEKHINKTVND